MILNMQEISIWMLRIKNLIHPHHRHHIRVAQVLNVMSIPNGDINHLKLIARYKVLINLILVYLAKANNTLAAHNKKLLILSVMPMFAFGNTRLRNIDRNLSAVRRLQELRERTPIIYIHL